MVGGPGPTRQFSPAGATSSLAPYQYAPEQERPVRDPRRVWPWITALLLIAVLAAGYLLYHFVPSASGAGVPDVTGLPVTRAVTQLQHDGYKVARPFQLKFSPSVPKV